ncbi:NDT80/PhoG like DNA-binding family protein [Plectosphaerella plurivora]|uniref:NDT80/PhoG like DNA-binding family protein n=1 Tax=Plectosphaerella plurivora TaxID=936078 RepID=A0A9P9ABR0_9PEZI|nr:NDT80/PhoG like DNA-binding family protein [Plectosphaerella plurivora]
MADLKEPAHASLWSNYGSPLQSASRVNSSMDAGLPGLANVSAQPSRPRNPQQQVDTSYSYGRYPQDDASPYDRQPSSALSTHHSYPNLKRPYSHPEQPSYQEVVQDLRDDGSKLSVGHDHKMLSFKRAQDKHTILDQHGRMHHLELSAQLHGMFFLSEMPASAADGTLLQPELTCYRRNLFQISGSLITPRGQLSVVTEAGETLPVTSTEVTVSAIESVDGHPVRLIVIPWKTPPPNSPELNQTSDQEPPALPLIPFQDESGDVDGDYAVYPIGWRRLQFRIATANNGRRKELQQHFVLHLKVMGTLSNGSKVVLTESITSPIVVRGRSPRNFQARKEIPLLGSSAGSRGQALVETGIGIVAGPLTAKPHDARARGMSMSMPRSDFTFSSGGPRMPGGGEVGGMRSNSYPNWSASAQVPMAQTSAGHGSGSYPTAALAAEPYSKGHSTTAGYVSEAHDVPLQTSVPTGSLSAARPSYSYPQTTNASVPSLPIPTASETSLSVPRYIDDSRPAKSPRHGSHPSVHSTGSLTNDGSSEYRYGSSYGPMSTSHAGEGQPSSYGHDSSATLPPPPRDYYASSNTWTSSAAEVGSTAAYAGGETRSYTSPGQYKSSGPGMSQAKPGEQVIPAPGSGAVYTGPPRESIDTMNHYSWHAI